MPDTDAQTVENIICETGYVRAKGGNNEFADVSAGLSEVRTLQACKLEGGTEVFLAASRAGSTFKFWNITAGGAGVDISATYDATAAATDAVWQTCVYRHRIFGCNGSDRPFVWTGSGDVALAAWTGPGSNGTNLTSVQPYRSRLYFCEENNASIWYTSLVDAVTGALVEVPLDSVLHLGGFPIFAGSSSNRQGDTNQELFVIYTTEGEVLVYQGRYPGDAGWSIVARYQIAPPLDYRCGTYVNNQLYLTTRMGPVGVHELLGGADFENAFEVESGKVRQAFLDASTTFSDKRTWQGIQHKSKNYVLFNIPLVDASTAEQYVMNTITKAWSRLTGWSAQCWGMFNGTLYYGEVNTGKVLEADAIFEVQNGTTLNWKIKHASSFLGNPKSSKKTTLIQPIFTVEKESAAETTDALTYGVDYDLEATSTLLPADFQVTSSTEKLNKPILPLVGSGKSIAVRLEDSPTAAYDFRYYGSWLQVEDAEGLV